MTEMISRRTRPSQPLLVVILFLIQPIATTIWAEGTNQPAASAVQGGNANASTLEIIKQLQRRIEELEQKVRILERSQVSAPQPADAKSQQQLEALDQKVKTLEGELALERETNAARIKDAPKIILDGDGFYLGSAKGDFALRVRALLQMDSRTFFDNPGGPVDDGFLLRRARPILEGRVFQDFDFRFVPDFAPTSGPQIYDADVNYHYSPALQFRAGKFKAPVGLELLEPDRDTLFNERALPSDLVPSRDVGFALHGEILSGRISYAAGIFNGTTDGTSSRNVNFADDQAFIGRLFFEPFKKSSKPVLEGIGFGVAGSYETMSTTNTAGLPSTTGGHLPGYYTDGQQQFFAYNPADGAVVVADGNHWRLSPQAYYYNGPFGLLGEYVISNQEVSRSGTPPFNSAHLQNTAWQIAASWVLTGEDASYTGGVTPRRPFNPAEGQWGSLQLVARYAQLSIDPAAFPQFSDPETSAGSAAAWAVGLNWYLNRNVRVNASFSHTRFDGGGGEGSSAPANVTRKDENVFFTRVQLSF